MQGGTVSVKGDMPIDHDYKLLMAACIFIASLVGLDNWLSSP